MIRGLGGKPPKETVPAPVGMRVLSEQGDLLGIVQDFVCEGKIVRSVLLSSGETCPPEKIHGVGECLILGDAPKKTAAKKPSAPLSETPETVGKSEETCEKEVAASAQAGSNLLTGKRVPRDISDVRGNVIIRKGSVITPEVLKSAIFHNKLFELTVTDVYKRQPRSCAVLISFLIKKFQYSSLISSSACGSYMPLYAFNPEDTRKYGL